MLAPREDMGRPSSAESQESQSSPSKHLAQRESLKEQLLRKEEPDGRKSRAPKGPMDILSFETGGGIVHQQLKSFKSTERRSTR